MDTGQFITTEDGRRVAVHDGGGPAGAPVLLWHHGSPQTGALLDPVLVAAAELDLRVVSFARAAYGGSDPCPGRDVARTAYDALAVAEALELDRLVLVGHSGGGPSALASAAVMPERVLGVAVFGCPAPYRPADDTQWFAGMATDSALRAALAGRDARLAHARTDEFDPSAFVPSDWATLEGPWGQMGEDAQRAEQQGPEGLVDDDVSLVTPWGVDLARVAAPVLVVHGALDRIIPPAHALLLARELPAAETFTLPDAGHLSVLEDMPRLLGRLLARVDAR